VQRGHDRQARGARQTQAGQAIAGQQSLLQGSVGGEVLYPAYERVQVLKRVRGCVGCQKAAYDS
jgi:hypothetical protein